MPGSAFGSISTLLYAFDCVGCALKDFVMPEGSRLKRCSKLQLAGTLQLGGPPRSAASATTTLEQHNVREHDNIKVCCDAPIPICAQQAHGGICAGPDLTITPQTVCFCSSALPSAKAACCLSALADGCMLTSARAHHVSLGLLMHRSWMERWWSCAAFACLVPQHAQLVTPMHPCSGGGARAADE